LNEGLATYLGWSAMEKDRIWVGEIPVIHLKTLKRLTRNGDLLPLEELLDLTHETFYRKAFHKAHYSQSWGFVFFLLHGHMRPHLSFNERLKRLEQMNRRELLALEKPFQNFCRNFSGLQLMKERLDSASLPRQLSSAFRLGLLQDDGAMGALTQLAMNRNQNTLLRVVALYASAMISSATMDWEVKEELLETLDALRYQDSPEIQDAVRQIYSALRVGDRRRIAQLFNSLHHGACFYPAARFLVVDEEKL
jgi:hypothetical protein